MRASGVVKVINKTVEVREIRLKGGASSNLELSEDDLIKKGEKLKRSTTIKYSHEKIYGIIPN